MSDLVAIISAIAAVVSAIGGGVACIAAFSSAKHAKATFDAGQLTEKKLVLRQLSVTAYEVSVEVDRIKWVAQGLKVAYQTLFTFAGQFNGSRQMLHTKEIDSKLQEADKLLERANPFTTLNESLINGPADEISLREIMLTQALTKAKALREKLEEEHRSIEAQNQVYRERILHG